MMDYFKETMDVHKRVLFSSEALNVSKIKEMKGELPANLKIVKIEEKHLKEGLIYDDVVSRFFTVSRFKENGFGFALTDEFETVQGFCLTNYPFKGQEIELYFRIEYDHFQDFRHKGFGIQLCSYLIEFCLEHDFDPVWDSANDTSSHIAKKLGYTEREVWYAFHVL